MFRLSHTFQLRCAVRLMVSSVICGERRREHPEEEHWTIWPNIRPATTGIAMDLSYKCVNNIFATKDTTYRRLACVMEGECVCKYYSDKLEAKEVWGSKCRERRRRQIICLLNNWLPTKPISDQIEFLNFPLNGLLFTRDSSDNYKDYLQAAQLPQGHPLFLDSSGSSQFANKNRAKQGSKWDVLNFTKSWRRKLSLGQNKTVRGKTWSNNEQKTHNLEL